MGFDCKLCAVHTIHIIYEETKRHETKKKAECRLDCFCQLINKTLSISDMASPSSRDSPESVDLPEPVEEPEPLKSKPKPKRQRDRKSKVYKTLAKNQCPSVCRICRNPAIGYHYEVPSCNGCKTFFRRTIISGKKFRCVKVSNCLDTEEVIDTSKRVCQACRFEKCVQAGMNPMAIQAEVKTDEGEELRKQIAKKRETFDCRPKFFNFEDKMNQVIRNLVMIDSKLEGVHMNGMPMGFKDGRDLRTILASKIIYSNSEVPEMSYTPVKLSKHTGLPKRRCRNFVHSSCLATIEFSKTFDFSTAIRLESKVLLLKHATLMCVNLTNAFTTFRKLRSDRLLYPDGSVYGPPPRKRGPLIEKQRSFLQNTLIAFMTNDVDRTEYLLLKAIVMCNPAVTGLPSDDQKHIQLEREVYAQCLLRYCLQQHGCLNGPARFTALISIFHVIENQQKEQKDYYVYVKAIHTQKHKDPVVLAKKCTSLLYDQVLD
uniref:Nuclear receptor domain-containing protein n=1 Tax=Caenorhabditis japonica TaxID=281687 RepID=A0A8R1DJB7_CAEJA